jgi:hypothetical protein
VEQPLLDIMEQPLLVMVEQPLLVMVEQPLLGMVEQPLLVMVAKSISNIMVAPDIELLLVISVKMDWSQMLHINVIVMGNL